MADHSFRRTSRLLNAHDFRRVFEHAGLKVSRPEVLVLARRNDCDTPRLGLVFAKKNVRLAVQRNRLKRIVRESFRLHQQQLPALDVVILARRGLDRLDNAQCHQLCAQLWVQLRQRADRQPTIQQEQ